LIYLALLHGQVVGMRGVYGIAWEAGPTARLSAVGSGDLIVAPGHEGRSLPSKIMRMAEQDVRALGYRYMLNLSASPATYLHSIRTGWRDLGALETMRRESVWRLAPGSRWLGTRLGLSGPLQWVEVERILRVCLCGDRVGGRF
jgi:GNAT superfamily N-acetyltransferase